jgi:hypothetical protein
VTYGTEPITILRTERLVTFDPDVARWDHNFLDGVRRERLHLRLSMSIQTRPHDAHYKAPTVSPGNAMIRFTSSSLGLIGELTKRARVSAECTVGIGGNSDVPYSHYIISAVFVTYLR